VENIEISNGLLSLRVCPTRGMGITRRVDFTLFMVEALENGDLIHEAPAIVGCKTPSALANGADR
jgi:hypothetical protein